MNYLIISNYYKLINKTINDIKNKNAETIKMDLNINTLEDIINEAKYNSLFDSNKNILVYNCNLFSNNKLTDEDQELLVDYLSNSNPSNNLIFIQNDAADNRKKVVKLIKDKGKMFDFSKLYYNDLLKNINDYIKENNWDINNDVINYIIKSCNNNYDLICNELDKLILCYPNKVSLDEARKIISTNINDNVFKFVDEVLKKDYEKSLSLLKDLKVYKVDPSVILNMIYRDFRFIFLYKAATMEKLNVENVFRTEGLADWQLNKVVDNSRKFSFEEVLNTIKLLSLYDYKYKSGKIDRSLIIETFLLEYMN